MARRPKDRQGGKLFGLYRLYRPIETFLLSPQSKDSAGVNTNAGAGSDCCGKCSSDYDNNRRLNYRKRLETFVERIGSTERCSGNDQRDLACRTINQ